MLAPAADTAGTYLVPRHTTSEQRRCYMEFRQAHSPMRGGVRPDRGRNSEKLASRRQQHYAGGSLDASTEAASMLQPNP